MASFEALRNPLTPSLSPKGARGSGGSLKMADMVEALSLTKCVHYLC